MTVRATAASAAGDSRPFKVEEAAKEAGIGLNQMYAAIHRGEVPSIKIGRRILVPRKAFLELLNSGSGAA
jgi:excisionase family DNA binding protein